MSLTSLLVPGPPVLRVVLSGLTLGFLIFGKRWAWHEPLGRRVPWQVGAMVLLAGLIYGLLHLTFHTMLGLSPSFLAAHPVIGTGMVVVVLIAVVVVLPGLLVAKLGWGARWFDG